MKSRILLLILLGFGNGLQAQQSFCFRAPDAVLREVHEAIQARHERQALRLLEQTLQDHPDWQTDRPELLIQELWFLYYSLALQEGLAGASQGLMQYLQLGPASVWKQRGYTLMGKYYFLHGQYQESIRCYEQGGISLLTNEELVERNFELGYAYLVSGQLDKVDRYFQTARSIPGDYFKPGNYYHGLLAYYKKQYAEARSSFLQVKDDPRYKDIVPFYLLEIRYLSGEKDSALQEALPSFDSKASLLFRNELHALVAQLYAEKDMPAQALLHQQQYMQGESTVSDQDYLRLGYYQLQLGQYDTALHTLEQIQQADSSWSSSLHALLASASLQTGQFEKARTHLRALIDAAPSDAMREEWAYQLTLLATELDGGEQAYEALRTFQKTYPDTHADIIRQQLVDVAIQLHRYEDAKQLLLTWPSLSFTQQELFQKLSFALGCDKLIGAQPEKALHEFEDARKYPADASLVSQSDYYLTECCYRLQRWDEALTHSDFFLHLADTLRWPNLTADMHLVRAYIYKNYQDTLKVDDEYRMALHDTDTVQAILRMDSLKKPLIPQPYTSVQTIREQLHPSLPLEKLHFTYQPVPIKPLALEMFYQASDANTYMDVAAGTLSALDVKGGLVADRLLHEPLYADASYHTLKGALAGQDIQTTSIALSTQTRLDEYETRAQLSYQQLRVHDYGFNPFLYTHAPATPREAYHTIGFHVSLQPVRPELHELHYRFSVYTGIYTSSQHAFEWGLRLSMPVDKQIKHDLWIQADIHLQEYVLFTDLPSTRQNFLLCWKPAATKQIGQLRIRAGLSPALGEKIYLLPDLRISYPLYNGMLTAEAGLRGEVQQNTYQQLTEQNPHLSAYSHMHQTMSTRLFGAVSGSVLPGLDYRLQLAYTLMKQMPVWQSMTYNQHELWNQFYVSYISSIKRFEIDADVRYMLSPNEEAGLTFGYHPLLGSLPAFTTWYYAASTAGLFVESHPLKKLNARADLFFHGAASREGSFPVSEAPDHLKAGLDMNLQVHYQLHPRCILSAYGYNLFNTHYMPLYQYPQTGIRVSGGCRIQFGTRGRTN